MKKRTKSLLEEINNMVHDRDKHLIIESKADHIIASAINLVFKLGTDNGSSRAC